MKVIKKRRRARRALKTGIFFERVYNTGQHMAQYTPYADGSPRPSFWKSAYR